MNVAGMETIQQRRGQITEKPVLLTGPGKVSRMSKGKSLLNLDG